MKTDGSVVLQSATMLQLKTHELVYDGETEHQHFDLTMDILDGDIKLQ